MNDEKAFELQLEGAAKQNNPVVKTNQANEEMELNIDKKPPAARSSKGLEIGSSKKIFCANSAGEANAMNAWRTKGKQGRGGRGFQRSLLQGPKKKIKEIAEGMNSDIEIPLSGQSNSTNVTSANPVVSNLVTGDGSKSDPKFVTECSMVWSLVCFMLTSCYTAIAIATLTRDRNETERNQNKLDSKLRYFYAWICLPISGTAMVISFLLKPRRNDFTYKFFLYSQFAIFTLVSEVRYSCRFLCVHSNLTILCVTARRLSSWYRPNCSKQT